MVAISFMKQFAPLVESGKKRQTIREKTKAFTGCKLQLYYGQRTKKCRKLMDAVCTRTLSIRLSECEVILTVGRRPNIDAFARRDGFKNYREMWNFFKSRADENGVFWGWLIEW